MEKTKRLLLFIGVAFMIPAIACAAPVLPQLNTTTATGTVIFAQENQTPGVPTEPPVDPEVRCLKTAAGAFQVGGPCILGIYAAHYDIIQKPTDHQTIVTDSLLHADLSLWAVSVGKLEGTAHLTYSLTSKYEDTEGVSCISTTEVVEPFGWDVRLSGDYFVQPDGSIDFVVRATPKQGPDYVEAFTACNPARPQHGVIWSGLGGKFVQGVFQAVTDSPVPADSTGRFYTEVWLGVVE